MSANQITNEPHKILNNAPVKSNIVLSSHASESLLLWFIVGAAFLNAGFQLAINIFILLRNPFNFIKSMQELYLDAPSMIIGGGVLIGLGLMISLPLFVRGLVHGFRRWLKRGRISLVELIVICLCAGLALAMVDPKESILGRFIVIASIAVSVVFAIISLAHWPSATTLVRLLVLGNAALFGSGFGRPYDGFGIVLFLLGCVIIQGLKANQIERASWPRHFQRHKNTA